MVSGFQCLCYFTCFFGFVCLCAGVWENPSGGHSLRRLFQSARTAVRAIRHCLSVGKRRKRTRSCWGVSCFGWRSGWGPVREKDERRDAVWMGGVLVAVLNVVCVYVGQIKVSKSAVFNQFLSPSSYSCCWWWWFCVRESVCECVCACVFVVFGEGSFFFFFLPFYVCVCVCTLASDTCVCARACVYAFHSFVMKPPLKCIFSDLFWFLCRALCVCLAEEGEKRSCTYSKYWGCFQSLDQLILMSLWNDAVPSFINVLLCLLPYTWWIDQRYPSLFLVKKNTYSILMV